MKVTTNQCYSREQDFVASTVIVTSYVCKLNIDLSLYDNSTVSTVQALTLN